MFMKFSLATLFSFAIIGTAFATEADVVPANGDTLLVPTELAPPTNPPNSDEPTVADISEAAAPNPLIPIEAFAKKIQMWRPEISPNGTHIAYFQRIDGDDHLMTLRIVDGEFVQVGDIASGEDVDYNWLEWANNNRLIVSATFKEGLKYYKWKLSARRLMAVNKDGSDLLMLLQQKRLKGIRRRFDDIINYLHDDPDHILVGFSAEGDDESDVYKLNINTGEKELILEQPEGQRIFDWYSDWNGNVRYGYGRDKKNKRLMLVKRKDGEWYPLHDHELFEDRRFRLLGFSDDEDHVYVMSSHITGRDTVFRFNLETGSLAGKVFEHPEVDAQSIIIPRARNKVVAISYNDNYEKLEFLDDDYKRLRGSIDGALPNKYNHIVSRTQDQKFAIVFSGSASDSGNYYIFYNKEGNKRLVYLGSPYPSVDERKLSPVKRVTYEARDSLEIPAYLTIPKNKPEGLMPAVIMPHGGPWARDNLTYDSWAQFLANRGYVVLQPNFRGSTGYGDRYESLGYGAWGRAMQDDLTDGTRWLIDQGFVDPERICMVGGSYGGYASLMGIIKEPALYKCAAAWAAPTDIKRLLKDWGDYDSDNWDYRRVAGQLSKKEITRISPIKRIEDINAPVLLVHGTEDHRVDVEYSKSLSKKLKKAKKKYKYVEFEEESHFLEEEANRETWFRELEAFLAENIGLAPASQQSLSEEDAQ